MDIDAKAATTTRYIRLREVRAIVPLSRSRLYELIAESRFPAPIKLSQRAVAWSQEAVLAWLDQRRAESRNVNGTNNVAPNHAAIDSADAGLQRLAALRKRAA